MKPKDYHTEFEVGVRLTGTEYKISSIDTSSTCVDENEKREHEPVGTVLNTQWMSNTGGWEIGFHSKRKLFKGEKLYTAPQEQGCAECGKKASEGWALYCVKCSEPMREQEPVAWTLTEFLDKRETTTNAPLWFVDPVNSAWTPLYTTPPSKQEQAEKQEPYAYIYETNGAFGVHQSLRNESYNGRYPDKTIPVYTAPPKQEFVCSTGLCHYKPWLGLTDEEVHEAAIKCVKSGQSVNAAIRSIEAKLKEKNHE